MAIDTLRLRAHAAVLAHDSLAGRATGSRGATAAAVYIAAQLRALGLRPAGADYLEPVPLAAVRIREGTHLRLVRAADTTHFAHGNAFLLAGGRRAFADAEGDVVFLGLPAHAIAATAEDLRGRVVAMGGTLGAEAEQLVPALRAAGVRAVLQLVPDPDAYAALLAAADTPLLVGSAAVDDPVWQPDLPLLVAAPALTRALLASTRIPPLSPERPFAPVRTGVRIALHVDIAFEPVEAVNVVGVLPGSDPAMADTFVAYAAHYDHLGTGLPDERGDSIYNGFSDNAAGVAMLLAIADALTRARPPHSTLFLFFTGEERGLLGSAEWAARPSVPLDRIRALINLDGGAPPRPPVSWRMAGGLATPLGEIARQVAERNGWSAHLTSASPNSDHWPFLRRGVPALFLIPGNEWEATSAAERDALRARWDRYHRQADHYETDYPFAGLARYARLALDIGLAAAGSR